VRAKVKCLNIMDDLTKESVDIAVEHGIGGAYVARVLDQGGKFGGLPKAIRTHRSSPATHWISGLARTKLR
jgi:putative transposase